jgi:hypothetical protein
MLRIVGELYNVTIPVIRLQEMSLGSARHLANERLRAHKRKGMNVGRFHYAITQCVQPRFFLLSDFGEALTPPPRRVVSGISGQSRHPRNVDKGDVC